MLEMSRRAAGKRQKKTEKEMRAIERRLRQMNLDRLAEGFPDLDFSVHSNLLEVLSGRAICRSICHLWYDEPTHTKVAYNGQTEKMKRKSPEKYVVAY